MQSPSAQYGREIATNLPLLIHALCCQLKATWIRSREQGTSVSHPLHIELQTSVFWRNVEDQELWSLQYRLWVQGSHRLLVPIHQTIKRSTETTLKTILGLCLSQLSCEFPNYQASDHNCRQRILDRKPVRKKEKRRRSYFRNNPESFLTCSSSFSTSSS